LPGANGEFENNAICDVEGAGIDALPGCRDLLHKWYRVRVIGMALKTVATGPEVFLRAGNLLNRNGVFFRNETGRTAVFRQFLITENQRTAYNERLV
jgi:hypothetical protein